MTFYIGNFMFMPCLTSLNIHGINNFPIICNKHQKPQTFALWFETWCSLLSSLSPIHTCFYYLTAQTFFLLQNNASTTLNESDIWMLFKCECHSWPEIESTTLREQNSLKGNSMHGWKMSSQLWVTPITFLFERE